MRGTASNKSVTPLHKLLHKKTFKPRRRGHSKTLYNRQT